MPLAVNDKGDTVFLAADATWQPAKTAVNPQTNEKIAFDGQEWKPVPQADDKGVLGTLDDLARSIASGATFGASDVIAARINPAINRALGLPAPETTEEAFAEERRRTESVSPAVRIPGQIAGAVGSTVLAAPLVGAGATALGIQNLPKAVQFAGLGAAEAGIQGAFEAPPGKELEGALTNAPIGAVVGAAAPSVASGVRGLFERVRGAMSPQANVAADLGRALTRDADTPATVQARAAALEADRPGVATVADVGGENVRGLVERVAQTPGAGRTQVIPALQGRQARQAGRISEDLKRLTGTSRSAVQAIDETISERAAASRPLYNEALGFNAVGSPEIVDAFKKATNTGFGAQVLKSKNLRRTLQTEYGVEDINKTPLMVLIDAWKKGVDDAIGTARRGGKGNAARVMTTMKNDLLSVVDSTNPAYKAARDAFSGPSSYLDAIEEGRKILSRTVSSEEMGAAFRALSQSEQDAFRTGAVSSIIARMGNDPAKFGDMTKFIRSSEMRAKIAAIMPTPEAAAAWARRLEFEETSSELTNRALGNSATARRLAERADAEDVMGDLVMDAFAGPGSVSVLRRTLTAGPKWLRDTIRSRADAELADVLTNPRRINELDDILRRAALASQPASGTAAAATTAAGVPIAIGP